MRVFIASQQQSATSLQDTRPQTSLSGTLTCPWLPPLPVCNNRRLSANRINTAGAERGRGEALAQAQLSVSSQCGLTGVRFTRAWTGTQFQICAQRNIGHATTNTSMCVCTHVSIHLLPSQPLFSSVVTNRLVHVRWWRVVFAHWLSVCVWVWVCVFPEIVSDKVSKQNNAHCSLLS